MSAHRVRWVSSRPLLAILRARHAQWTRLRPPREASPANFAPTTSSPQSAVVSARATPGLSATSRAPRALFVHQGRSRVPLATSSVSRVWLGRSQLVGRSSVLCVARMNRRMRVRPCACVTLASRGRQAFVCRVQLDSSSKWTATARVHLAQSGSFRRQGLRCVRRVQRVPQRKQWGVRCANVRRGSRSRTKCARPVTQASSRPRKARRHVQRALPGQ